MTVNQLIERLSNLSEEEREIEILVQVEGWCYDLSPLIKPYQVESGIIQWDENEESKQPYNAIVIDTPF